MWPHRLRAVMADRAAHDLPCAVIEYTGLVQGLRVIEAEVSVQVGVAAVHWQKRPLELVGSVA
jgi:hypothetical protein